MNKKLVAMKRNLGSADRVIRVILFVLFAALYFTNVITGTWGIVLFLFGMVLLATAIINWCPIYAALGIKTCKLS